MDDALASLTPRRRLLLDSAVAVLGERGLRGLTHRAVDAQADLPTGSCSAYLRTRQALQLAVAEYVGARLTGDIRALSERLALHPDDAHLAAAATTALFLAWLDEPDLLVARLELTLEAARDRALAARFSAWRQELVEVVRGVIAERPGTGSRAAGTAARATVAALEGVLLTALLQPRSDRDRYVEETVTTLIGALSEQDREWHQEQPHEQEAPTAVER